MLRASGRAAEADQLYAAELPPLVESARGPEGDSLAAQRQCTALLAAEHERVSTAAVLAELLAPLLSARLPPPAAAREPAHPAFAPAATTRASPAPAPSIADFIDDMLGQQRASSPSPPLRRAS